MRVSTLLRAVGSRRFSMALVLAWMALLVVWVLPFEFYGLPDSQIRTVVYQEPFFVVVYAVLALNTLACVLVHARTSFIRALRTPSTEAASALAADALAVRTSFDGSRAEKAVRSLGFKRVVRGQGWVWGVKYRFGPLGTVLFHTGLLACLAALSAALYPPLLFQGSLVLAEGETYSGNPGLYVDRSADASAQPPALAFSVSDIRPRFYQDMLLFTALEADVNDGSGKHHVSLSKPWIPRPDTLVTLSDFGYALEVVSRSTESTAEARQVFKLKAFPSGQTDVIEVPVGTDRYRVYVQVYGDYVDRAGQPGVRSFNADNPYLFVSVARVLSASGERMLVSERLLPLGSRVALPHGEITFTGLRHYGLFRVMRSPAAPFVLASLLLLMTGTALRLLFPRTEALIVGSAETHGDISRVEVRSDVYGVRAYLTQKLAERMRES